MDKLHTLLQEMQTWLFKYGPNIISAILVLVIGMFVINRVAKVITKNMSSATIDSSLSSFLASIVSVGLKVLLLITVAGMLGIQTTSFVAIIGALGLAVGLALQGSLANFAGGVLILVFKPFKTGDYIEVGGKAGVVQEIQIFNTILLTDDHKTVILANGAVSNGTIVNHTRHGNLRVDYTITISASNDFAKVKTTLHEALLKVDHVLSNPAPAVNIQKNEGGAATVLIQCFAEPAHCGSLQFSLQETIPALLESNQIVGPAAPITFVKNV